MTKRTASRVRSSPFTIALGAVVLAAGFLLAQCSPDSDGNSGGSVVFEPSATPMRSTLTAVAREATRAVQTVVSEQTRAARTASAGVPTTAATMRPGTTVQPNTPIGGTSGAATLAPIVTPITSVGGAVTSYTLPYGVGAGADFWRVFFTQPGRQRDVSAFTGGIDNTIAQQIDTVQRTLDIAAYEWNSPSLTQAVMRAARRGVVVRMVSDDRDGLGDEATTLGELQALGIPVVTDSRRALMHNKFMILDGALVLTGSWNFTLNDTYRNNNNSLALRSRQAVRNYQAEFDEMFVEGLFGPSSPSQTPVTQFTQDGVTIGVYFAPEDPVIPAMVAALQTARRSIRFMAFSYTQAEITDAVLARARDGVFVQGIFERTGSETASAQLRPLACAGQDVRQDGNPFILHHKVFIIDDTTIITGSFNFSANATDSNDENMVIISDPTIAAQYLAEFNRRWAEAVLPEVEC